jgi:hypothetical protein
MSISDSLLPDRTAFGKDPFGYASTGWLSWGLAQNLFGGSIDLEKYPTREALKSPVLWLTHAHALSEAAVIVLRANPNLDHLPLYLKGICDAQYCGVGLMLVGYSLEICLKGMLILKNGVTAYTAEESKFKHH